MPNPGSISESRKSSPTGGIPFTENDVHIQLEKILASRFFFRSERLCRFIRFAASHALKHDGMRLKEYVVGMEVFDRGPTYDPRIDPIVRVEARRLRSKLKAYYAAAGRDDQLLIEVPEGTYAPIFRLRTFDRREVRVTTETSITVLSFANLGNLAESECFRDGLTEELIHQLMRVPALQVRVPFVESPIQDPVEHFCSKSDFVLRGSIRYEHESIRVMAHLIETALNTYVWSETYVRLTGNIAWMQEGIAQGIVTKLELTLTQAGNARAEGLRRQQLEKSA
jgi:serine/threonine-protein kinase